MRTFYWMSPQRNWFPLPPGGAIYEPRNLLHSCAYVSISTCSSKPQFTLFRKRFYETEAQIDSPGWTLFWLVPIMVPLEK